MNMKSKITVLLMMLFGSSLVSAQEIEFSTGTWQEIKEKALKEKKPIFIDAYTVWCGPCKKMAAEVFTDPAVGTYFNDTFINYKMDMEKGEGIEFAKTYDVTAFPTFLYFNEKGELVNKSIGYKESDAFIKSSKEALDPASQPSVFKEIFDKSDKSLTAVIDYTAQLSKHGHSKLAQEIALEYIAKASPNEKNSKEAFSLMKKYLYDYTHPLFKEFVINKDKYFGVIQADEANRYIDHVISNPSFLRDDKVDAKIALAHYADVLRSFEPSVGSDYYIARIHYFMYLRANDDNTFLYAKNFLDKEYEVTVKDPKKFYYLVYMANKYVNEEGEKLKAANRWVRKSIELKDDQYTSKFVLAQLLFKEGKYKEALPLAEEAMAIEKTVVEAGLMKDLFKAQTIPDFITKVKASM